MVPPRSMKWSALLKTRIVIMFKKATDQEIVDFAKNFSVMFHSGITVNETLRFLGDQAKTKRFKATISRVRENVESGGSLSGAFQKEQDVVGEIFVSFIRAGEASGTLSENLSFLADWLEKNHELKQEIKSATLYPKIVIISTFFLGGTLSMFILPRIIPLFANFKVELPLITRALISFASFIQSFWHILLVLIALTITACVLIYRNVRVRYFIHSILVKLPVAGQVIMSYQTALISRLLLSLFKSGIPVNESLHITAESTSNLLYKNSLQEMEKSVIQGTSLASAMGKFDDLYPLNVITIIKTGDKSGTLDQSLEYLATYYEKDVRSRTRKLPTVIEPLLLFVIGGLISMVALSIILPIYKLTSGFMQ